MQVEDSLIWNTIIPKLAEPSSELADSVSIQLDSKDICFTTDSYVVKPLFFNGGDIGKLAVCGTVNDLAVAGAIPQALSLSLIIETGLEVNFEAQQPMLREKLKKNLGDDWFF